MGLDVFSFGYCGVSPLGIYGVTIAAALDLWGYGVGGVYLRGCSVCPVGIYGVAMAAASVLWGYGVGHVCGDL